MRTLRGSRRTVRTFARAGALAAAFTGLVAAGSTVAAGDPSGGQGTSGAPTVHSGGGGGKPDTPPGAFTEAPRGFEVSASHNDELKHHWPEGFPTGGTTVDSDTTTDGDGGGDSLFPGPVNNGWIPYDAAVASGPGQIVALVNSSMTFYDKTTHESVGYHTFDSWWGTSAGSAFDPKCFYDPSNGGHFVMLATSVGNGLANMYVSVSKTSDATGDWYTYTMDWRVDGTTMTNNWGDFPGLGYDDDCVYVTANQYGSSFRYAKIRVLRKSELYTNAALTFTDFVGMKNADGTTAFTVKPARCVGASGSEYLLNTRPGGGSSVTLWRIDNGATSPALTRVANVAVGTYGAPPDAPQSGARSAGVDTGDCRTQEVVYRDGNVYTAFTERFAQSKRSTVAAARFLKISSAGTRLQDITYTGPSGASVYYPAVMVGPSTHSGDGAVIMGFDRSSASEYISSYVVTMASGASSFSTASTRLAAGTGVMRQSRWGDYNGIDLDGSGAWLMNGVGSSVWSTDISYVAFP